MTDRPQGLGLRPTSLRLHIRQTLRLAIPVIIARSGQLILQATDSAMTGHYSVHELAFLGLGSVPAVTLMLIGMGALLGTSILTAQAVGAGETGRCGTIWKVGLIHGVVLGIALLVICQFAEPFFLAIGQAPELAAGAARVSAAFGLGLPAILAYSATAYFLEAIGRPLPGMYVMLSANLLNGALNWLLIYGNAGLPALGAEGAILATSVTRWCVAAVLIGYALRMRGHSRFGVLAPLTEFARLGRTLRGLGYPVALAQGMEVSAFMVGTIMAGYLGAVPLAGYQVANSINIVVFMSAIGLAIATGVRVGNCVGAGDRISRNVAGWTGTLLVIALSVVVAAGLLILAGTLVSIYSGDAEVRAVAISTLNVIAVMFVFNGITVVMIFALRGAGQVWAPLVIQVGALWCVGIPLAAWLAFAQDQGAPGLALGLYTGLAVAAALSCGRFLMIAQRPAVRI
jgi:MATE family multidrug resistance protein